MSVMGSASTAYRQPLDGQVYERDVAAVWLGVENGYIKKLSYCERGHGIKYWLFKMVIVR